jgi:hypothetical protein
VLLCQGSQLLEPLLQQYSSHGELASALWDAAGTLDRAEAGRGGTLLTQYSQQSASASSRVFTWRKEHLVLYGKIHRRQRTERELVIRIRIDLGLLSLALYPDCYNEKEMKKIKK